MKKHLKIKALTALAAISLSMSALTVVDAAAIGSLPWSKDFEDLQGLTYSGGVDASQNQIDAQLYMGVGSVSVVSDDEEHGNVLKADKNGAAIETFIGFKAPMGKDDTFAFSFDVKALEGGSTTLTAHDTGPNGWNPIVRASDTEWTHFLVVVDNTAGTSTVYSNGTKTVNENIDQATGAAFNYVSFFKFIIVSGAVEFDNFRMGTIGDVTDVELYADGAQVLNYAPCTDELEIRTSDWNFGDGADGIKVKDAGANPFFEMDDEVEAAVKVSGSKITVKLAEPMKDGHRYRIVLPESLTNELGGALSKKEFLFKAAADGGIIEKNHKINFAGKSDSDLNTVGSRPAAGAYVSGDDGLYYVRTSSKTRNNIVDDATCTGSKALKLSERASTALDFGKGISYQSGKIKVDGRVKINSGNINISIGNSEGLSKIMAASGAETEYWLYDPDKNAETSAKEANADGYLTYSYLIDLDKNIISECVINGKNILEGKKTLPLVNGNSVFDDGISMLQFECVTAGGEYLIDYIDYTLSTAAPDISSISMIDNESNRINYDGIGKITPSIDNIRITFNEEMDNESLKNITITGADGEEVQYVGSFVGGQYIMRLSNYLAQNSEYTLTIPQGVRSVDGNTLPAAISGDIKTGDGKFAIVSFRMEDESGNELYAIPNGKVIVKAVIDNTAEKSDSMTIVYTENSNKLMKEIKYSDFEILPEERKAVLTAQMQTPGTDIDEIKAFLWNDMKNHIPLFNSVKIK